jgi:hypothetical protein
MEGALKLCKRRHFYAKQLNHEGSRFEKRAVHFEIDIIFDESDLRKRFMKKFARERVVPIISASTSSSRMRASRFSLEFEKPVDEVRRGQERQPKACSS